MPFQSQNSGQVAVTTSSATTGKFLYANAHFGRFRIVSGSITSITWYDRQTEGGTVAACYDAATTPAAATQGNLTSGQSYPIMAAVQGAYELYPVGNAAGVIEFFCKE
jgi:hypothetical protein